MPRGALRRTPAWGALLVSFFVGAALIAALIDIPLFARTTVYPDDQLPAASTTASADTMAPSSSVSVRVATSKRVARRPR